MTKSSAQVATNFQTALPLTPVSINLICFMSVRSVLFDSCMPQGVYQCQTRTMCSWILIRKRPNVRLSDVSFFELMMNIIMSFLSLLNWPNKTNAHTVWCVIPWTVELHILHIDVVALSCSEFTCESQQREEMVTSESTSIHPLLIIDTACTAPRQLEINIANESFSWWKRPCFMA